MEHPDAALFQFADIFRKAGEIRREDRWNDLKHYGYKGDFSMIRRIPRACAWGYWHVHIRQW
jgi:hypothetical protein